MRLNAPLTHVSPGVRSSTRCTTPLLMGLAYAQLVSMALSPLRTRRRAANVPNESPPSKRSTNRLVVFLEQFACAASAPPSPSTLSDSSAMATVVAKSCKRLAESLPPHTPMHASYDFLHPTGSPTQANASWRTSCTSLPT